MYDTTETKKDEAVLTTEFAGENQTDAAREWPVQQQQRQDTELERIKALQAMQQQIQM
ncbi:MAG: hypothetical protein H6858_02265 [Rhodospirillales bacterium]|nr:hypothetical protein [Alphaproteobacteria bacterium]MCB1841293.1 hypothetical protein [Alphaproteobacteria bacterium]MCB9976408.1 hypothetical protein [Rhodospirillales bacterium]